MTKPSLWSVSGQLRLLVVAMLCIVPVVAGSALLTVRSNSRDTARTSLAFSPAIDATASIRQRMTDANAAWSRTTQTGVDEGAVLRASMSEVERLVSLQEQVLRRDVLTRKERATYADLTSRQETAARAWFSWVAERRSQDGLSPAAVLAGADGRMAEFRSVSDELESELVAGRTAARARIAGAFDRLLSMMAALTLLSVVGAYLMWRSIDGSLSAPVARLRQVVARQRGGDNLALADASGCWPS